FSEKMRKAAGDKSAEGFLAALRSTTDALKMAPEERRRRRVAMPNFWNRQAENTLDRATAMMPKMLYDRLDEIGLDFAVVYPTAGLRLPRIKDDETRRTVIRGYNIVSAEYFSGLEDRLTPAAIIPMHHPEEAIAELEFVPGSSAPRSACSAAACRAQCRPPRTIRNHSGSRSLMTCWRSTASTTTTRSGRNASSWASRRPSIRALAGRGCGTRRRTSSTTISAISRRPATPSQRRSSSA